MMSPAMVDETSANLHASNLTWPDSESQNFCLNGEFPVFDSAINLCRPKMERMCTEPDESNIRRTNCSNETETVHMYTAAVYINPAEEEIERIKSGYYLDVKKTLSILEYPYDSSQPSALLSDDCLPNVQRTSTTLDSNNEETHPKMVNKSTQCSFEQPSSSILSDIWCSETMPDSSSSSGQSKSLQSLSDLEQLVAETLAFMKASKA